MVDSPLQSLTRGMMITMFGMATTGNASPGASSTELRFLPTGNIDVIIHHVCHPSFIIHHFCHHGHCHHCLFLSLALVRSFRPLKAPAFPMKCPALRFAWLPAFCCLPCSALLHSSAGRRLSHCDSAAPKNSCCNWQCDSSMGALEDVYCDYQGLLLLLLDGRCCHGYHSDIF